MVFSIEIVRIKVKNSYVKVTLDINFCQKYKMFQIYKFIVKCKWFLKLSLHRFPENNTTTAKMLQLISILTALSLVSASRDYYSNLNADFESSSSTAYFIEEPENVTTRVGERVLLGCRVANVNSNASVQWTRDDFGLGTKELMAVWPNMRIILHSRSAGPPPSRARLMISPAAS